MDIKPTIKIEKAPDGEHFIVFIGNREYDHCETYEAAAHVKESLMLITM